MTALAACPNLYLKVGGNQMTYNGIKDKAGTLLELRESAVGSAELADLTYDIYSFCISTFGPAKCMFQSNFPVRAPPPPPASPPDPQQQACPRAARTDSESCVGV